MARKPYGAKHNTHSRNANRLSRDARRGSRTRRAAAGKLVTAPSYAEPQRRTRRRPRRATGTPARPTGLDDRPRSNRFDRPPGGDVSFSRRPVSPSETRCGSEWLRGRMSSVSKEFPVCLPSRSGSRRTRRVQDVIDLPPTGFVLFWRTGQRTGSTAGESPGRRRIFPHRTQNAPVPRPVVWRHSEVAPNRRRSR